MLSVASPCFPRQAGADAELQRRMAEAIGRFVDDPAKRQAFERARGLAATQQRYIQRSDPVACEEVRALLQHLLGR